MPSTEPNGFPPRVIVGISGASGVLYGVRALELLGQLGVETHLVLTRAARATLAQETSLSIGEVRSRASVVHSEHDLGASIASGSFPVEGMLVAPCSVKTLSGISNSYDDNLLVRSADVTLKERRPLVLLLRETPLHAGHIRLMAQATEAGAVIMPPVPAFYSHPESIEEMVTQTAARALDALRISHPQTVRWGPESRMRPHERELQTRQG